MTYRSECTCGCHSNPGMDPTPSSSSEPVGIDLSEFPDLPSDTRISIRIVSGEMAGTEIDNVPFSVFTPTPPSRKKPDWRDPFCKRRDENVLSNIRDAYFYGFEDALEIVSEIPTPAPNVEAYRQGIRDAVTFVHHHADQCSSSAAKSILNGVANAMGHKFKKDSPVSRTGGMEQVGEVTKYGAIRWFKPPIRLGTKLYAAPGSSLMPSEVECVCKRAICSYDPDFGCGLDRSKERQDV